MNNFEYKEFKHVHIRTNTDTDKYCIHISWATLQWELSFITALYDSLWRPAAKAKRAATTKVKEHSHPSSHVFSSSEKKCMLGGGR